MSKMNCEILRILEWEDKREEIEIALFGRVLNENQVAKAAGFLTLDCLMDYQTAVNRGVSPSAAYEIHGCGRRLKNVRA